MTAFAVVHDRRAFVCTAQLNGSISDLLATTLGACFLGDTVSSHVVLHNRLDG